MNAMNLDHRHQLGEQGTGVMRAALALGVAALIGSLAIAQLGDAWARFFRAYLTAFMFVLSICLGGVFFTFVQHLTRAGWSVGVRRVAEVFAANLIWIWILWLPIGAITLFGEAGLLYSWTEEDYHAKNAAYLNETFWIIRAVFFFAVWAGLGWFLYRNSVEQDRTGDVKLTHRLQRWAPVAAVLYALTQTFAVIDWVMALGAPWFSTMFGVYFFAASCCGFFSAQILTVFLVQRAGRLGGAITLEHYQDMGKQLFAFGIVFWAYIAFSQYMLIWYGNLPEETTWFMVRQMGGWAGVSVFLLAGHFAIPFLLLVSKHPKRIKGVLALMACGMLGMHFIDMYWLVMPRIDEQVIAGVGSYQELAQLVAAGETDLGWSPHLLDLTCLLALASLLVVGTAYRLRTCALMPLQDPRLRESLAFENM